MYQIVIRNLEDIIIQRLKQLAWQDGRSFDDMARRLLVEAVRSRAARRPLDIVDLNDAPPQLRFEIARGGRVLIERVPYAWADFRARAMIDWWDWAPTARMIHAAAIKRLRHRTFDGPA